MLELVIVVTVATVVAAMTVPVILNANNAYQLRTATIELASSLQKSRMYCIRQNQALAVLTTTSGSTVFLDVANNGSGDSSSSSFSQWPQVTLPTNITQTNSGHPSDPTTLGFTPQNLPAYFNGRGLPCIKVGAVCTNYNNGPVGYVYYIKQVSHGTRWSAVSITPAGQVKTWSYNGSGWSNR